MKLQQLLQDLTEYSVPQDCVVGGLSQNSKKLQKGDLFIALNGQHTNGNAYIQEALANGAVAVLAQEQLPEVITDGTPVIYVDNLSEKLNIIASRFYGNPGLGFKEIIGVTGTNGKTTTCYLLAQTLSRLGNPCALIGTIGTGFVSSLETSGYTTPEPISLQKYLKSFIEQGAQAVCMEVSSHGLIQHRVDSVNFSSAHFTNLTQDHLDYHGTMQAYGQAKQKLFQFQSLQRVVVNADDAYSQKMLNAHQKEIPCAAYTLHHKMTGITGIKPALFFPITTKAIELTQKGISAVVDTPWGQGKLHSPLLGRFNLSNILAVLAELCLQGYEFKAAIDAISHAHAAPGRMQKMGTPTSPQVIIDYAHTPDALENALLSSREHCQRRLWCVFGCGGDRDKDKRAKMGAIAAKLADRVIITNDNPRTENPHHIIEAILQGVSAQLGEKVMIEESREAAIQYAFYHALAVDTILIAGKGHENYQIIGESVYPFSDAQIVDTLLREDKSEAVRNR